MVNIKNSVVANRVAFRELAADFLNVDPDSEEVTMSAETNMEVSRKVQGHFEVKDHATPQNSL